MATYINIFDQDQHLNDPDRSLNPYWVVAIFPLGKPISYSRKTKASTGNIVEGSLLRKDKPLIITNDIININVNNSKSNYLKSLSLMLKGGDNNYLNANAVLTGDHIMAWITDNQINYQTIINNLKNGAQANSYSSGLKFIGRVNQVRKRVNIQNGIKSVNYSIQAQGFEELSTQFFYDPALATQALSKNLYEFMAQIGVNAFKFLTESHKLAGQIKDNSEDIFDTFIDIVVGKGRKLEIQKKKFIDQQGMSFSPTPQLSNDAPYSYLIPKAVGITLGLNSLDENKGSQNNHNAFGYSDILMTLTGVQKYNSESTNAPHKGLLPNIVDYDFLNEERTENRLRTPILIKGTFIPIEPVFINKPLWQILSEFKNPTINEMYTCIKPNLSGDLMPTIVLRQIPFSTNSIVENSDMPLTKFMELPRWQIPNSYVLSLDVGRSSATRFNFIHVYGQVSGYAITDSYKIASQMVRNAPITDTTSMACYGLRPYMATVACSVFDTVREDGNSLWMEAIADWTINSEHTLNGTINCKGISMPICEGDNLEIDDMVFHIESVAHNAGINNGKKYWETIINVTNGMPSDQSLANEVAPRYPGFNGGSINYENNNSFDVELDNILKGEANEEPKNSEALQLGSEILGGNDPGISID